MSVRCLSRIPRFIRQSKGASYSLAQRRDPQLEAHLDALVELIAAAQEPDGYLYTNRTIDPLNVLPFAGPKRWSNLVMSHELYNSGHLYEAACAHFLATGKRGLLEVALRNAALVRSVFNPNGRHDMCGHQIVEMGLARLYRITQDRSLLETARFFLEERGRHESRPLYSYADNPGYSQDHIPVREQSEAVGHAVRAAYMYCGMADVAALFPDDGYAAAITAIWRDVVGSKTYLTGGIGARHKGEAFGDFFRASQPDGVCGDVRRHRLRHVEPSPFPADRRGAVRATCWSRRCTTASFPAFPCEETSFST